MAADMHINKQTKWRATGHLGKYFGQRSFQMPLCKKETPFVTKVTPLNIPTALPRRSSCKLWKLSGVLPQPTLSYPTEVPLQN